MPKGKFKIPLFFPNVTEKMKRATYGALGKRTLTQGKTVDEFERKLSSNLGIKNPVTVNSCTSALELTYRLINLKPKDEIIGPVFAHPAAYLPVLRRRGKVVFADIGENMLLDWADAAKKITTKTRAVVNVHLFGQVNRVPKLNIPIIGDAAQCLAKIPGQLFTCYSFQATKIMTTVDGGVLSCSRPEDYHRAKLLRWYGIDRETGRNSIDVDILEPGYKYHMSNITAALGIAALSHLPRWQAKIRILQERYRSSLEGIRGTRVIGGAPFLIHTDDRDKLFNGLAKSGIEAGLGHRRNDLYTVFGGKRLGFPNMNRFESTYLLLPCRANMRLKDVDYICKVIKKICQ